MTDEVADYDPHESLWETVASLEQNHYTKREIHDALVATADELRPASGGFER